MTESKEKRTPKDKKPRRMPNQYLATEVLSYLSAMQDSHPHLLVKDYFINKDESCLAVYRDGLWEFDQNNDWLKTEIVSWLKSFKITWETREIEKNGKITETEIPHLSPITDDFSLSVFDQISHTFVPNVIIKYKQDLLTYNSMIIADFNKITTEIVNPNNLKRRIIINVLNGVVMLDLSTKEVHFENHRADYYFTAKLQVEYNPKSKSGQYLVALKQILPNREDRIMFKTFLGYSLLTHDFSWECAPYLYGTGSNGKSTLVYPFTLFFEKISALKLDEMSQQFGKQSLLNCQFVWSNENQSVKLNTSTAKTIISNEPIFIDQKNAKALDGVKLNVKMIIQGNGLIRLYDLGSKRRFYIIRFTRFWSGRDDLDPELTKKLTSDPKSLEGMFNWLIRYIFRYYDKKADLMRGIAERYDNLYHILSDPFRSWCDEFLQLFNPKPKPTDHEDLVNYIPEAPPVLTTSELLESYNEWAEINNHDTYSSHLFTKRFKGVYKDEIRKNEIKQVRIGADKTRGWRGIDFVHNTKPRSSNPGTIEGFDFERVPQNAKYVIDGSPELSIGNYVNSITRENGNLATLSQIIEFGKSFLKMSKEGVEGIIKQMCRDGSLSQPKRNHFRVQDIK